MLFWWELQAFWKIALAFQRRSAQVPLVPSLVPPCFAAKPLPEFLAELDHLDEKLFFYHVIAALYVLEMSGHHRPDELRHDVHA